MSRVYDAMRRAAERRERGGSPESPVHAHEEASETDEFVQWDEPRLLTPPRPATTSEAAASEVDEETRERLDALQVSLSALEDRLDDDESWPTRSDPTPPSDDPFGTPRQRIDWMGRVAQLEVAVHALEDQLAAPDDPAASARDAVDRQAAALETDRVLRRLELHIESLRARADQGNLRQNLLFGGLALALISIYAC